MSYREKSAWAMAALTAAAGLYYLSLLLGSSAGPGTAAPPVGAFVAYTILVVAGSVAAQVALAALSPREAAAPADERERPLLQRAGNWSGRLFASGAVLSLLAYLGHGDGNLLFHTVLASLIVSQLAEYGFQIALFRRSV